MKRTRGPAPWTAAYGLPSATANLARSAGTSSASSLAVASPRAASAASVSRSAARSQRSPSAVMPAPSSIATKRLRSPATSPRAHAAWTTGASATGTTNTVRRIPRIRTSARSS